MQFDVAALRQFVVANASPLTTIAAAAGGTLVILLALGGVWAFWPESHDVPADAVAVGGPAFTPVVMSPRTATTAAALSEDGKPVSTPYDDLQRQDDRSLARAVQKELKRAGCYDGPINGAWSPSTRKAMGEFTGLVNARLPVDHPDPILLVLLETHDKVSCTPGGASARRDEYASTSDERPDDTRAARYDVPKAPAAPARTASAEQQDETPEPTSVSGGAAATAAGAAATTAAVAGAASQKSAAVSELGTDESAAAEPRRKRKYRNPSLSRQVSKGFKSIQRSLNKIFW